jgi:hypothetical protein
MRFAVRPSGSSILRWAVSFVIAYSASEALDYARLTGCYGLDDLSIMEESGDLYGASPSWSDSPPSRRRSASSNSFGASPRGAGSGRKRSALTMAPSSAYLC